MDYRCGRASDSGVITKVTEILFLGLEACVGGKNSTKNRRQEEQELTLE